MSLSPIYGSEHFQCLHCGIASQQTWFDARVAGESANAIIKHVFYEYRVGIQDYEQAAIERFMKEVEGANREGMAGLIPGRLAVASCGSCGNLTLWVDREMIYPRKALVAAPNLDLDPQIRDLYSEAASIVVDSEVSEYSIDAESGLRCAGWRRWARSFTA